MYRQLYHRLIFQSTVIKKTKLKQGEDINKIR